MITKVDELIEHMMMRHTIYVPDRNERWAEERNEIHIPTREEFNELVTAAKEEGTSELRQILDILWDRMREWETEWRAENPEKRELTSPDTMELIEWKIATAREEGRAEERERIVCGSQRFPKGEYAVDSDYISMVFSHDGIGEAMTDCELFIIPASLLAPAPKEKP